MILYVVFALLALLIVLPVTPLRWSFLLLVLMAQLSFAGPEWHSMTQINLPNTLKILVLPSALLLRYYSSHKPHFTASPLVMCYLLFMTYAALGILWSPVPVAALKELGYLLSFFLTITLAIFLFRESRGFLLRNLPVVVLGSIGIAIWQTYFAGNRFSNLDGSLTSFAPKNAFGFWLVFCEVLLLAVAATPHVHRLLTMCTAFFLAAAQVGNSSRTSLLAGTVVVLLAFGLPTLFRKTAGSREVRLCAVSWLAGAAFMGGLVVTFSSVVPAGKYTSVVSRYREAQGLVKAEAPIFKRSAELAEQGPRKELSAATTTQETARIKNLSFRLTRWRRAIHELKTRGALELLMGSGTSSSVTLVRLSDVYRWHRDKTKVDSNRVLHNAFLRVAVEWGLIGIVLFSALVGKIIVVSLRLIRARTNLAFAILALGLVPFGAILLLGNPLASSGIPSGMGIAVWIAALLTATESAGSRVLKRGIANWQAHA